MARRSVGMVSPSRTQGLQYPPMVRQGSYYSLLTLDDEVQSHYQLGNTGKPLHSMNLDELHKNVISADQSGQLLQDPSSDHNNSFILGSNGSLNNDTLSNKTNNDSISESWRKFVLEEQVSRSMDTPLKQQPSLGENLENFLARAGVINVGDHQDHNVNVVIGGDTHHQALMGMDPMVMHSQQEHWLQMQIPAAINIHQHQEQQHHHQQMNFGGCQDFSVPKSLFYENQVMEIGYSENSAGISSMSPAYSDSKSAVFGKNKYSDEVLERTIERRQKRMAKNRESAGRSRAKKQEHINRLEKEKCRLQKMNSQLKKLKVHSAIHFQRENNLICVVLCCAN
ncbi:hypothetical protein GYH30_040292 [Glycine max]|nr:hypothetical protein GYH30_040292 [Glycine max]